MKHWHQSYRSLQSGTMSGYAVVKQDVALGRGLFIRGYTVTLDGKFHDFFKHPEQARRYVERANEELTRDG